MSGSNPLIMSDEDFMKLPLPEAGEVSSVETQQQEETQEDKQPEGQEQQEQQQQEDTPNTEDTGGSEGDDGLTDAERAAAAGDDDDITPDPNAKPEGEEQEKKDPASEPKPEGEAAPTGSEKKDPEPQTETVNYENLYTEIMKPFKANGRTVELKDAAEVRQLMQMGANYTKKMQELQPAKKMLLMLQNNDLLDEGKLDYLIALDKKDPEAIKKLIKDSGIDPLDIDTNTEHAFREGSHRVTDEQVSFQTVLDELDSTQEGKETLNVIDKTWDHTSKGMLGTNPEFITVMHEQRQNGVYDRIVTEMDRRKTLGQVPASKPFIYAYKEIGDELAAAGKFADLVPQAEQPQQQQKAPVVQEQPKVVTTRAAAPKAPVVNGDKAGAASPTRSSPGAVKEATNFLAMSDDDFLKKMEGRV